MEVPNETLKNLNFAEFKKQCVSLIRMSDEEIKQQFAHLGQSVNPQEIRMKYQCMEKNINEEDYRKLQTTTNANSHKTNGNFMLQQGRYVEALTEYNEALEHISEISDPVMASRTECAVRLNMALAHLQQKHFDSVIYECKRVLSMEPYCYKAIYRISSAFMARGESMAAKKYLKRITLRKSMDSKFAAIHREVLGTVTPKQRDVERHQLGEKLYDLLDLGSSTIKREIEDLFDFFGIVINTKQFQELIQLRPLTRKALNELILKYDRKRKLDYYMENPVIEDLLEDDELLEDVEKLVEDKTSDFTQGMLAQFKGLTHKQLQ